MLRDGSAKSVWKAFQTAHIIRGNVKSAHAYLHLPSNCSSAKSARSFLCNSAMVVVIHMPGSDSDDGSCSPDLNYSSRREWDAMEAIRLKKLRQRERVEKLHTGLRALRSMVPKGRGSLAEDTAAYVQQLRAETQIVQAEIQQILLSNKHAENMVKVEMDDSGLIIEVECEKRPGLALALSRVIDGLELTIIEATMRCQHRIKLRIVSEKAARGVVVDVKHVKTLLQQSISYSPCSEGGGG